MPINSTVNVLGPPDIPPLTFVSLAWFHTMNIHSKRGPFLGLKYRKHAIIEALIGTH